MRFSTVRPRFSFARVSASRDDEAAGSGSQDDGVDRRRVHAHAYLPSPPGPDGEGGATAPLGFAYHYVPLFSSRHQTLFRTLRCH